jgi:hypothetical protein
MEGGVKLGTLFVDHNFHLVFERDIEGFELGHMLQVRHVSPTIMELSTRIGGSFTWIKKYHGKGASTMENGCQPSARVQLGTLYIVIGDWVELACDPDWVEQQLDVKICIREKSRNVVEIRNDVVEASRQRRMKH